MASEVQPATGVVSKSRYAQHRGCSAAYISKLIRRGTLAAPALLPDGKINVLLADQMLGQSTASGVGLDLVPAAAAVPSAPSARSERELHQARLAKVKADEAEGRLLRRADVELRIFEVLRRLRDELLAMPASLAPTLARLTDEREIEAHLNRELEARLARTADALEEFHPDGPASEEEDETA